jgi:acyl dehydratase
VSAVLLSTDRLGEVADSYSARIDPEDVAAYSAATGRPAEVFGPGSSAPPLFGVVPSRPAVLRALRSVVPEEVGLRVPVLHGEHDVRLHKPIRCGEVVEVQSRALGVRQKSSGCLVLLGIELSAAGEPVEQQRMVVFLPGATGAPDAGEEPEPLSPVPAGEERLRSRTLPEQSRLYAAASGDDTAFHVDDAAARRYGFPGVIMHGLCTLATVVGDLVTALDRDPTEVARVSARFSAPALPGEDVLSSYDVAGSTVSFTAAGPDGRSLLQRARLELR